ncbi:MAG: NUDIX domain-containing protein [Treponema sp.]|nr:NUDIX domain-containing protein [Treponema sp.]
MGQKRSVAGIAIEGGALFIARRKSGGDLGGKWEFPGGKVERGESDRTALQREFREEFGLDIEIGPLLATSSFEHKGNTFSLNAYRIFFEAGEPGSRIHLREHTEWRWAALKGEIEKMDFADSYRGLFPALQVNLNQEAGIHH